MAVMTIQFQDGQQMTKLLLELDPARPHHRAILNDLNAGLIYEPDISGALRRILKAGDVFVDVGANIGFLSIFAARLVGVAGRVISLEPGSNALVELRGNIALNDLANVTIVPKAASDKIGETKFFLNSDNAGGNALWDPAEFPGNDASRANPQVMRVPMTRLDAELPELLQGAIPKAIKIDTEGAELLVLRGAEGILSPAKVPFVICELHEFGLTQLGCDQTQLRNFMNERGYETFMLSRRDSLPLWIPRRTQIVSRYIPNLIFATRETIESHWPRAEFAEPY